jgi:hypothetical protein
VRGFLIGTDNEKRGKYRLKRTRNVLESLSNLLSGLFSGYYNLVHVYLVLFLATTTIDIDQQARAAFTLSILFCKLTNFAGDLIGENNFLLIIA